MVNTPPSSPKKDNIELTPLPVSSTSTPTSSSSPPTTTTNNATTTSAKSSPSAPVKKNTSKLEPDEKFGSVPYFQLYRFSGPFEKFLLFVAVLGSAANGVAIPVMSIILGNMIEAFSKFDFIVGLKKSNPAFPAAAYDAAENEFYDSMWLNVDYFYILSGVTFIAAYFQMAFFQWSAESQITRIKEEYLKALLRQEVAYFDSQKRGALTNRIASDTQQIKDGISDKVGNTIQYMSTFISGFVIAFVKGPILTAILLVVLPFIVASGAFTGKVTAQFASKSIQAYASAGGVAEEMISAIRTVVSFGGEHQAAEKYHTKLKEASKQENKKGYISGIGIACIFFFIFSMYALGFWAGSKLLANNTLTLGSLVNVFMAFLIASFSLGNAAPNISYFATARVAAFKIFQVIDRKSVVNPFDEGGKKPDTLKGHIVFKNVNFAYPTRLDVPILIDFNMEVLPGQTVALVGQSGSGKSTCVGLMERFYVPLSGTLTLDGVPFQDLNIQWLRGRIGYVGQEPVLFSGTIRENIAWGSPEPVTDDMIVKSLQNANAYDFVMELPKRLDTMIGEKGANLSGGQKQRIAIARALIRDPPIIIFDEATSALDTQSEKIVQEALNNASKGRTTIVIAHRLSTVKNADNIIAMRKGEVIETGTHEELLKRQGYYHQLVRDQQVELEEEEKEDEDDDEDDEAVEGNQVKQGVEGNDVTQATNATNRPPSGSPKAEMRVSRMSVDKRSSIGSKNSLLTKNVTIDDEVPLEVSPFTRAVKLNKSQWKWIVLGVFGAIIAGSVTPAYALIYSQAITSFSASFMLVNGEKVPNVDELNYQGSLWGGTFLGIALAAGISNYLQITSFIVSGEVLVLKMRSELFKAVLRQEISFFDRDENAVGTLASKLSLRASLLRNLVGDAMGTVVQVFMSIVVGSAIALATAWQLALVVLAFAPFIMLSGVVQGRILNGLGDKNIENKASKLASEVVSNVRTVASLGLENKFLQEYHSLLEAPKKLGLKEALIGAIVFGLSSCIIFITYGTAFIYAAKLIVWGTYRFEQVFRAIATIVFSALLGGRIASFLPDYSKARQASIEVFQLLDRKSHIDIETQPTTSFPEPKGSITFNDVHFRYPGRKEVKVHRGLCFSVPAGSKAALVGASGSGKSSIIQLLERFYDPEKGSILIDNINIMDMNVNKLRGYMALVGQEPCLLDGTIYENIQWGALDPSQVTKSQVYEAARLANVHTFIENLPLGYDTPVGEKGGMLSGGQKQRVAIARAMIRNPKILLLDEATSALDAESETLVQAALDAAAVGRTTLIVAHRLSTVQNADIIFVVHRGKVVETGTHKSLIAMRGHYFKLVESQMEVKKASSTTTSSSPSSTPSPPSTTSL